MTVIRRNAILRIVREFRLPVRQVVRSCRGLTALEILKTYAKHAGEPR